MIKVRQIKVLVKGEKLEDKIIQKLKIKESELLNYKIIKESIDARDKNNLFYIYEVDATVSNEENILRNNKSNDILKSEKINYEIKITGDKKLDKRPIIIGSGPAGLFSAYYLAKLGYKPIIIERGKPVEERTRDVEEFWKNNKLNINSNVQFGEGGAGTFSDGKLNTLVKDKIGRKDEVLKIFVENGADESILYKNKPHIGTDILVKIVKNMRNKIISWGGTYMFDTTLTDINVQNGQIKSIVVNDNETIETDILILAIGHSARDTFKMLFDKKINMSSKPFALGVRIMHPQEMINMNQYGTNELGSADYKLTYKASNGRGVYSFCMCPGGYVVNASSEKDSLAINGMSYSKRDSGVANSAIIVTVSPLDYGEKPLDGIEFQRKLEMQTYNIGNGNIPVQLYKDYKDNKTSDKFNFDPRIKGNYEFANINDIFPNYINESLKEAIENFDKKIKGFNRDDAIIAAIESRTSSPIRIERDENLESNIKGIYPIGEGSGYAGGITTSAIDGLKVVEIIASNYKN